MCHLLVALLMLGAFSCAPRMVKPSPGPVLKPIPERRLPAPAEPAQPEARFLEPAEKPQPVAKEPTPRMLASLQLTQQGQSLIEKRQADSAIRTLEKAVAIDPSNGRNYYYLAEAWLIKGDPAQAANYNELASIHLRSDDIWRQRVAEQKQRIGRSRIR